MTSPPRFAPPLVAKPVDIPTGAATLQGALDLPADIGGLVIFPLVSASLRHSPRYRRIAGALQRAGLGTLVLDLLTTGEARADAHRDVSSSSISFLADRLASATRWVESMTDQRYPLGLFAAGTGAAAALTAAAREHQGDHAVVKAIVSADGRPDLAQGALAQVDAPTLLIAGERDAALFEINRQALNFLTAECHLEVFPEASRPSREPGAWPHLIEASVAWFGWYLRAAAA